VGRVLFENRKNPIHRILKSVYPDNCLNFEQRNFQLPSSRNNPSPWKRKNKLTNLMMGGDPDHICHSREEKYNKYGFFQFIYQSYRKFIYSILNAT